MRQHAGPQVSPLVQTQELPFQCWLPGHSTGTGVGVVRRAAAAPGERNVPVTTAAPPIPSKPFSTERRLEPAAIDLTNLSKRPFSTNALCFSV
jgi:hypothetical protein